MKYFVISKNKLVLQQSIANKNGFTLVEISMVLLIIAGIMVTVLAGKNFIQQANLRAVMTEVNSMSSAFNNFQLQYNSMPGDFSNASTMLNCGNTNSTVSNCNGNGDGWVTNGTGAGSGTNGFTAADTYHGFAGAIQNESLRAWQHLNLAGLFPGNYIGCYLTSAGGTCQATAGVVIYGPLANVPSSRYAAGGYMIHDYGTINLKGSSSAACATSCAGNALTFGTLNSSSPPTDTNSGIMLPADAMSIDQKMDDGLPTTGLVLAYGTSGASSCYTASSIYNIASTTVGAVCSLVFTFRSQ